MKIRAFEIKQKNIVFYVAVLKNSLLSRICSTTLSRITSSTDIYQRRLNKTRVNSIALFAKRNRSVFPTSIVLNSSERMEYDSERLELTISDNKDAFFIIDGQHRIAGIKESGYDFEMSVVIFNNIDLDLQSELFLTINSEQKTVNPNVRFNMKSNDIVFTPEKMIRNIAELLNNDSESPLFNKIWMDDKPRKRGEYPLSLSAFCNPICEYVYNSKNYYSLKDELYKNNGDLTLLNNCFADENNFLWNIYKNHAEMVLYKILLNYFTSIKCIYQKVWDDPKSSIIKTTGYNALIILFKGLFMLCKRKNNNYSFDYMHSILSKRIIEESSFYAPNIQLGKSGAYELYLKMKPEEIDTERVNAGFMDSLDDGLEEIIT